jgi:hypothetical protein
MSDKKMQIKGTTINKNQQLLILSLPVTSQNQFLSERNSSLLLKSNKQKPLSKKTMKMGRMKRYKILDTKGWRKNLLTRLSWKFCKQKSL